MAFCLTGSAAFRGSILPSHLPIAYNAASAKIHARTIPFLMLAGGWTGSRLHEPLAGVNAKVKLAKQILNPVTDKNQVETFEIEAFKSAGKQQAQVFTEASDMLHKFYIGGWSLGGFIGLVFGGLIAGRMITKHRTDYTPNKGTCFSCARCVDYCPVKLP